MYRLKLAMQGILAKKRVAHAASKLNYARNPQPKIDTVSAASKLTYARNPHP